MYMYVCACFFYVQKTTRCGSVGAVVPAELSECVQCVVPVQCRPGATAVGLFFIECLFIYLIESICVGTDQPAGGVFQARRGQSTEHLLADFPVQSRVW